MGQKKSRLHEKENSTRRNNVSEMKYVVPHDPRYYNSEQSVRQSQQGGHNYEQQWYNLEYQAASSHDQPQGKPLKSKKKSKKKKKDKKNNVSEMKYVEHHGPRYYNSEQSVRQSQQGGHNYEQQWFSPEYQAASSHYQPQVKSSKSKRKSEQKKKKDKKPKKSKRASDSERSVSKEQKNEKKGEVHTTEKGHMASGTKMDRSHNPAFESASGWIDPRERNNMDYHHGSHDLQSAGQPTSFSTSFSKKRKEDLDIELKQMKELLSRKEEELRSIRERLSRKDEELHGVRQDLENTSRDLNEKIRKHEEDLERKTEKIKHLEADKNDLMNRLSSEAAARMIYNNPNITDLSDQDRPTKISERYAELYDNQWTDAFQDLQKSYQLSDTEVIEVLLDVLYISFDVCKQIREQRQALVRYLTEYVGEAGGDAIVSEVMTILKGAKKKNIAKMHKDYAKKVQEVLETKYSKMLQCIGPYVTECVELCLLMNIQDPALELNGVVLGENPLFDVAVFRPYTKSGSRIEHMVWPALYLCNNGPLLCRGVAQGMRDLSEGHKLTIISITQAKKNIKVSS